MPIAHPNQLKKKKKKKNCWIHFSSKTNFLSPFLSEFTFLMTFLVTLHGWVHFLRTYFRIFFRGLFNFTFLVFFSSFLVWELFLSEFTFWVLFFVLFLLRVFFLLECSLAAKSKKKMLLLILSCKIWRPQRSRTPWHYKGIKQFEGQIRFPKPNDLHHWTAGTKNYFKTWSLEVNVCLLGG